MILDPNGMPILQPTVDNAETATFNDAFAAIGSAIAGAVPTASTTVSGIAEFATDAETIAGIEPALVVTTTGLKAARPNGVLLVQDQKATTVDGGTFTSGAWRVRDLNTAAVNTIAGASISSNTVTLPAGTYDVEGSAPAFAVSRQKARLRQTSGTAATLLVGTSGASDNGAQVVSLIRGRIVLTESTTLQVQHICFVTKTTNGFGVQSGSSEIEIYTTITFTEVAA